MDYLEKKDLESIFELIRRKYTRRETIPEYTAYKESIQKLLGVLEGARHDEHYATLAEKTAHLLIQINKGHFFPNGNKRLALVCAITFIYLNGWSIHMHKKKQVEEKLKELFHATSPRMDYPEFKAEEFAFYNLSMIIAESEKYTHSFEELKEKVKKFLVFSLKKRNT
jgi:death-on-curing family protein